MDYNASPKSRPRMLSEEVLCALEKSKPGGMTSAEIVDVFRSRGIKFSEASFRKYVQQGLLSRSRRVGTKGKHKGSKGIYPIGTLRQINEIKKLMSLDFTIEEIRGRFAFVGGDVEELRSLLAKIVTTLEESCGASESDALAVIGISRRIDDARRAADDLVGQLEEVASKIREKARIAKDAV